MSRRLEKENLQCLVKLNCFKNILLLPLRFEIMIILEWNLSQGAIVLWNRKWKFCGRSEIYQQKTFLYIFTANELMLVIYVKDCKDIWRIAKELLYSTSRAIKWSPCNFDSSNFFAILYVYKIYQNKVFFTVSYFFTSAHLSLNNNSQQKREICPHTVTVVWWWKNIFHL